MDGRVRRQNSSGSQGQPRAVRTAGRLGALFVISTLGCQSGATPSLFTRSTSIRTGVRPSAVARQETARPHGEQAIRIMKLESSIVPAGYEDSQQKYNPRWRLPNPRPRRSP